MFNDTHRGFGGYLLESPGSATHSITPGDTQHISKASQEIGRRLEGRRLLCCLSGPTFRIAIAPCTPALKRPCRRFSILGPRQWCRCTTTPSALAVNRWTSRYRGSFAPPRLPVSRTAFIRWLKAKVGWCQRALRTRVADPTSPTATQPTESSPRASARTHRIGNCFQKPLRIPRRDRDMHLRRKLCGNSLGNLGPCSQAKVKRTREERFNQQQIVGTELRNCIRRQAARILNGRGQRRIRRHSAAQA